MSVLICYDGSPSARNAIASAATLLPQRSVTLLYVWDPPLGAPADSFSYREDPSGPSPHALEEFAGKGARELVDEGRRLAQEHGFDAQTLITCNEESTPDTILRVAEEQQSSLIVLGAHPRGVPGPTLDSISAAVAEHSQRPVLVVPLND